MGKEWESLPFSPSAVSWGGAGGRWGGQGGNIENDRRDGGTKGGMKKSEEGREGHSGGESRSGHE